MLAELLALAHANRAVLLGLLAIAAIIYGIISIPKRAKLPVYSTHSGWFAGWYDSLDYLHDSPGVLKAGYEKVGHLLGYLINIYISFIDTYRSLLFSFLAMGCSTNFAPRFGG